MNNNFNKYKKRDIKIIFTDCQCDPNGSSSKQCQSDGKCDCKNGFNGDKCGTGPKCEKLFF